MNSDRGTILVTGATGRQGGAVVRHLLARGWGVRALTRDAQSIGAKRLRRQGAEVVRGDLEDEAGLATLIEGVHGVFAVQVHGEPGVGHAGEVRQGGNLARAAQAVGVRHFVQSSIAGCDDAAGLDHFESKHRVETHVDALRLPRTFLRTVFFMENWLDPRMGCLVFPFLAGGLDPDTGFHLLAVDDLGWFAAEAFDRPDRYLGRTIDVAGDCLRVEEMRDAVARATGSRPSSLVLPAWVSRMINPEMARELEWHNRRQPLLDVAGARALYPGLQRFEGWLRTQRDAQHAA
jgi:uncharacterized protein YbjT (DUF2867 family)